jgi:prepilin-type processing-associated H-X9-DG protein
LIEVLVTIGIVGLVMAMLIPAIASSRRAALRTQCTSNLRQIGQAIQAFESVENGLPHFYFHNQLLPYIEQGALAKLVDLDYNITADEVAQVNATVIPLYQCPSDPAPESFNVSLLHPLTMPDRVLAGFNYAPNANWMIRGFPRVRLHSATLMNGASNSVLSSEVLRPDAGFQRLRTVWDVPVVSQDKPAFYDACTKLPADPYAAGFQPGGFRGAPWSGMPVLNDLVYQHRLPPNRPNCESSPQGMFVYPSVSAHTGGVQALYADGHVDFISQSIDAEVWERAGTLSRQDGLMAFRSGPF